ncbi:MAG: group 1 truncated hemoglobin [Pseudomonadales bacterium]|nr:group 1 truncated hemoglobin [Pseudomonadales bacterium]
MSLYSDLGGEPAIDAAVDIFYDKVIDDTRVSYFFDGVDMRRQKNWQKRFFTYAFGGPNKYNGAGMRKAHEKAVNFGLKDMHFDIIIEHLGSTLLELGVPREKVNEAAKIAETTRSDVLHK